MVLDNRHMVLDNLPVDILQGPGCRFNDRVKKIIPSQQHLKDLGLNEAWDIEDLGLLGKKHKVFMQSQ